MDPGSESGYVQARFRCPHAKLSINLALLDDSNASPLQSICSVVECSNTEENCVCTTCGAVFCGRWKQAHMVQHNQETGHNISLGFADLSFWCYGCDSYLHHLTIRPVYDAYCIFHQRKFGESVKQPFGNPDPVTQLEEGLNSLSVETKETKETEETEETEETGASDTEEPRTAMAPKNEEKEEKQTEEQDADLLKILQGVAQGKHKNVIVMCGAGISVSAGIPDFRTPGTGLYDNLAKYNLPQPEAIFDLGYLRKNPKAFNTLAKELFPGDYSPTPTHHFIKLLHDQGVLLRCFSQNIDGLEQLAGLPEQKLVQAHGGFSKAHCIDCSEEHPTSEVRKAVMADEIPRCKKCKGLVKPDIVFFGENLPARYFNLSQKDFKKCDLLIVMGTSLQVQPFAGLIDSVKSTCPRILVNREKVAERFKLEENFDLEDLHGVVGFHVLSQLMELQSSDDPEDLEALNMLKAQLAGRIMENGKGFDFGQGRDFFVGGDSDNGVKFLCKEMGGQWLSRLETAVSNYKLPKL